MFYKKRGIPKEGELVVCTVKRILPHCAFLFLDEYENLEGMLHISEVSSRWINDIKSYLRQGQKLICKVQKVDEQKGFIDLSLKRVSPGEKKVKSMEWKLENKTEKMLEHVGKEFNKDMKQTYEIAVQKLISKYGALHPIVNDIKENGKNALADVAMPQEWKDAIFKAISEAIRQSRVDISGKLDIRSIASDGAEQIRLLFKHLEEYAGSQGIEIGFKYAGGGKYLFDLKADDYKAGEDKLENLSKEGEKFSKDRKMEFSISR